jgi:hypothetical protein
MAHLSFLGYNPLTLSPLFRPLLFSLSPTVLPFQHTYLEYICATNAMEYVLPAFVHWQDAPSDKLSSSFGGGPGSAASLDVPTQLKDWIWGYPAMLLEPATQLGKHDSLQPRHGACTMCIVSVR